MRPILFSIGPYQVYAFGFFLALSFILATFVVWKFGKEELREEEYLDAFLYTSIMSLISARVVYAALHFSDFGGNILKYFVVRQTPGLSLLGGLAGGLLYLLWYTKRHKLSLTSILDLFSIAACIALVLAKIGEQLGGAGFGKETSSFLAVRIAGVSGLRHPVELYEAFAFLLLAVFLFFIYHQQRYEKWPKGTVASFFIFGAALIIFGLEFFKVYPVYLYGLSIRQFASLILAAVGIFFTGRNIKILLAARRRKS